MKNDLVNMAHGIWKLIYKVVDRLRPAFENDHTCNLNFVLTAYSNTVVFSRQMQQRESSHMKTLAEEWKRRDKERELMVKKKVKNITTLILDAVNSNLNIQAK